MGNELLLQISAGDGPAECAWAVMRTFEQIAREAEQSAYDLRLIELVPGPEVDTANSILLSISSESEVTAFANSWQGTVQWIVKSPFRPNHKRKNWFVGVEVLAMVEQSRFNPADLRWESMRASGPGGQHVNKAESAIRVTHVPTGIQAVSADERSQFRNRKIALARLEKRLADLNQEKGKTVERNRWRAHHTLSRGNPIRTFRC